MMEPKAPWGGARGGSPDVRLGTVDDGDDCDGLKCDDALVLNELLPVGGGGSRVGGAKFGDGADEEKRSWEFLDVGDRNGADVVGDLKTVIDELALASCWRRGPGADGGA
jgi:hypothetical protein